MASRRKRQRLAEDGTAAITTSYRDGDSELEGAGRGRSSNPPQRSSSLFVRSLPLTASADDLTDFFSQSYPVKHALVVLEKGTGNSKGFGFVTLADADDAGRAQNELHGSSFHGNKLQISFAKPRQRHSHDEAEPASIGQRTEQVTQLRPKQAKRRHSHEIFIKLIVRNLPWSINEPKQLARLFMSYGKVKYATLPKCKPGLSPGFGFVVLRGEQNAEKAIAQVNGKSIDGRALAVDRAVDKDSWEAQRHVGYGESDRSSSVAEDAKVDSDQGSANESANPQLKAAASEASSDAGSDAWESGSCSADSSSGSSHGPSRDDVSGTLFVRNLPFTATDELLFDHFNKTFGPLRYARIVLDQETERSKGTGFVCFRNKVDAWKCLRVAPKTREQGVARGNTGAKALPNASLLQDMTVDPQGRFTMQDRVMQISQAVGKDEVHRITTQRKAVGAAQDRDKRHLYLLSEGSVPAGSPLHAALSHSEIRMREQNLKQRQTMMRNNPSLYLSLTRLSVRNVARQMTAKDMKALARQAVVAFAKDVKEGRRDPLSKEEVSRDREQMKDAERARRLKAKGIVKQAKIVYEGNADKTGKENSLEGQSRGFGFIEYSSHRWALMGLRWLNGYRAELPTTPEAEGKPAGTDRQKRLVVEFAIENARVVAQRRGRGPKAHGTARPPRNGEPGGHGFPGRNEPWTKQQSVKGRVMRLSDSLKHQTDSTHLTASLTASKTPPALQQIIGRKRARKGKRGSAH